MLHAIVYGRERRIWIHYNVLKNPDYVGENAIL